GHAGSRWPRTPATCTDRPDAPRRRARRRARARPRRAPRPRRRARSATSSDQPPREERARGGEGGREEERGAERPRDRVLNRGNEIVARSGELRVAAGAARVERLLQVRDLPRLRLVERLAQVER